MNLKELKAAIDAWVKSFEAEIEKLEARLKTRVIALQKKLLDELQKISEWLQFEDGVIVNSVENMDQLAKLEPLMNKFEKDWISAELKKFAQDILSVGDMTASYYELTGVAIEVENISTQIRSIIGIDSAGELLAGGYLDRLGKTAEVRQAIRDYVLRSIVSQVSLSEFKKGLEGLIVGNKDIEGALLRYWRQFAFDTFNTVHEIANKTVADQAGLKHFIFQGSVIDTTRRFCEERAGKVFSTDETETWKDDPNLVDKKTKDSYKPLLERGRYNCRHFITYISEALAISLRPDLKK